MSIVSDHMQISMSILRYFDKIVLQLYLNSYSGNTYFMILILHGTVEQV